MNASTTFSQPQVFMHNPFSMGMRLDSRASCLRAAEQMVGRQDAG